MKRKYLLRLSAIVLVVIMSLSLTACDLTRLPEIIQRVASERSTATAAPTATPAAQGQPGSAGGQDASGGKQENPVLPSPGAEELAQLRADMNRDGYGVAVAFLGLFDMGDDYLNDYLESCGALEAFPFLEDFPVERLVRAGGYELYLVIPANHEDAVCVKDWVLNESNGYRGEAGASELYSSESGEPFLLECNYSEIMPNAVVYVGTNARRVALEYTPALSQRDGSLLCPETFEPGYGVLDISLPNTGTSGAAAVYPSSSVEEIRAALEYSGEVCAMAFLGWFGSTWEYLPGYLEDTWLIDDIPCLADITEEQFACGEGEELYLIIPRDPYATVTVNQLDASGAVETVLYHSEYGDPILVQGNTGTFMDEDVLFNLELTIVESDGGWMTCLPGVDFSYNGLQRDLPIRDLYNIPVEELESASEWEVVGMWEGYVFPDDGRASHSVYFELYDDGTMYYLCSTYDEQWENYTAQAHYYGTWEYRQLDQPGMPASAYVFDLTLEDSYGGEPLPRRHILTTQYIAADEYGLNIQLVDGNDLYPNCWEYTVYLSNAYDTAS